MERRRSIPNKNTKNKPLSSTFCRRRRTWSFYVVVLQWTALKSKKIYNARAQLLFSSLNLLFSDGHVAIVVVVCLSSLLTKVIHFYSELNPSVLSWLGFVMMMHAIVFFAAIHIRLLTNLAYSSRTGEYSRP